MDTKKMVQASVEMRTYELEEDDSILLIEMWSRRACTDQGWGDSEALIIIWDGILRWWRRKLMIYFF